MPKARSYLSDANWSWKRFHDRCRELEQLFLEREQLFMDWSKWASKLDLAAGTIRRLRDDTGVVERSARKAFQKINLIRKRFELEQLIWENEIARLADKPKG